MGMERTVEFADGVPAWAELRRRWDAAALTVEMRMIDGQLALPGEEPADDWGEVRVGLPAGMVTLRRAPSGISFVIWGNSDEAMLAEWERLMAASGEPAG